MPRQEPEPESQPRTPTIRVQSFRDPQRYGYDGLSVDFHPADGHTSEEATKRMAAAVAGDIHAAQAWMDRPNLELPHRTPRQAYRDGDVGRVIGILANVAGF